MTHCNIQFRLKFLTSPSETVHIVGNHKQLGCWNPSNSLPLTTNPQLYPYWVSQTPIKAYKSNKIEFKACVVRDGQVVRWENLPNNENRKYKARHYSTLLEMAEGSMYVSETIEKKFASTNSLENLDSYKRMKKADQIFNPFENAQNSFSSDCSWDDSDMEDNLSDDCASSIFDDKLALSDDEDTVDTRGRDEEKELRDDERGLSAKNFGKFVKAFTYKINDASDLENF